jgi:hypothetical protein
MKDKERDGQRFANIKTRTFTLQGTLSFQSSQMDSKDMDGLSIKMKRRFERS